MIILQLARYCHQYFSRLRGGRAVIVLLINLSSRRHLTLIFVFLTVGERV